MASLSRHQELQHGLAVPAKCNTISPYVHLTISTYFYHSLIPNKNDIRVMTNILRRTIVYGVISIIFLAPVLVNAIDSPTLSIEERIPLILFRVFEFLVNVALWLGIIFIVIGGFAYLFAWGDKEKISGAHKIIVGAIIGTLIAFSAKAIMGIAIDLIQGT